MALKKLRDSIDAVDRRILKALNERARLTMSVGKIKNKKGLSIYAPGREKQVYEKLKSLNRGPVAGDSLRAIYREIMSSSLSLEKPIKVAYLGPELTFTHQAAMEKFGKSLDYEACKNISDVFSEVEKGLCDYGVVPIENSTEGAVNYTLDMFASADVKICAEAYLAISHNLLGRVTDLSKVKYVYSHPMVFGQCRIWLETNLPHAELRDCSSTTEAAMIVSRKKDAVCIASLMASGKYGLKLLAQSIQDSVTNVTRFLVIAGDMAEPTGDDKTSVMFSVRDRAGALHDILVPFKKHRINMTKIESRPSKFKAWKYYFFVDLEGHINDKKIRSTLKELESKCTYFKVLGSYPVCG